MSAWIPFSAVCFMAMDAHVTGLLHILFRVSGKEMFNVYFSEITSCSLYFGYSLEEAGWFSSQLKHFGI